MMLISLNPDAAAMQHFISSLCQPRTLMEIPLLERVEITTVMQIWLEETGAQNSISWRPTLTPGTLPHINVMLQMIRDITTTVTEVVIALKSPTAEFHMVQEIISQSILSSNSISKPNGVQMALSPSTLHKVKIPKQWAPR